MTERTPAAGGEADRSGPSRPDSGERRRPAYSTDLLTDLFVNPLDPGYADAAARRSAGAPLSGLRRLIRRSGTVVVLTVFGFLLASAYLQVVKEAPEAARVRAQLVKDVTRKERESRELQRRAEVLRDEVARARDRALAGAGGGAEADRLRTMEAGAGLAKVTGPGVVVTLSDGPRETDSVTGEPVGEDLGRVLDRDLQRLVNALWQAGAEAISIDGQRLSSVSTIRAAGQAILVDFTPVADPYRVRAIGPPTMRRAFVTSRAAEQFRWLQNKYQMGFDVSGQRDLTLPAAADPQLRHAKPPKPDQSPASPSPTGGG